MSDISGLFSSGGLVARPERYASAVSVRFLQDKRVCRVSFDTSCDLEVICPFSDTIADLGNDY